MNKTSVYLTNEERESLRRIAESTGRSQAELIRDGIEYVVRTHEPAKRHFLSRGVAHADSYDDTSWDADELYRHVMGERD